MAFFGIPLFPASLFLHLGPLLSKIRVTWMQSSTVIPHSGSHDPAATEGTNRQEPIQCRDAGERGGSHPGRDGEGWYEVSSQYSALHAI